MSRAKLPLSSLAPVAWSHWRIAAAAQQAHTELTAAAIKAYGAPEGWPHRYVSGIMSETFPEHIKERLRALCYLQNAQDNAGFASAELKRRHPQTRRNLRAAAYAQAVQS